MEIKNLISSIISYEEYLPFGGTSFTAGRNQTETKLKEYRFTDKERDDFSGLYYFGARYYAPWLGRWMSADPSGPVDGGNLYVYCQNNPVGRIDPDGRASIEKLWDGACNRSFQLHNKDIYSLDVAELSKLGDDLEMSQGKKASFIGKWGEDISKANAREKGKIVVDGGKNVNGNGADFLTYDPKTAEVEVNDNKETFSKKQKNAPTVAGFDNSDVKAKWESQLQEMVRQSDLDDDIKANIRTKLETGDYKQKVTSASGGYKDVTAKMKEAGVIFEETGGGERRPESKGFSKTTSKISGLKNTVGCVWMDFMNVLTANAKLDNIYSEFDAIEKGTLKLSEQDQMKYNMIVSVATNGKDFYKDFGVGVGTTLGIINAVNASELINTIWNKQIEPTFGKSNLLY